MKNQSIIKIISYIFLGALTTILFSGTVGMAIMAFPDGGQAQQFATMLLQFSLLVGGFTVGFLSKNKGLKYGFLLGLLFQAATILIALGKSGTIDNLQFIPVKIILSAIGGWAGEQSSKLNSSNER